MAMDKFNGFYHKTHESLVFDDNGKTLEAKLADLETKLSNVLEALKYATFTQDVSGILSDL